MRLINADALEDVLREHGSYYCNESVYSDGVVDGFHLAIEDLKETPTIDAVPVKRGKWIYEPEDWRHQIEWFKCSCCGSPSSTAYKWCPYCGARMKGAEE